MPSRYDEIIETRKPASLGRRISGSIFAPLMAWLIFNLGSAILAIVISGAVSSAMGIAFVAIYSAVFVFCTWLLLLLPLYLLIPQRSMLWLWPTCTLCGAMAGTLIVAGWGLFGRMRFAEFGIYGTIAAIIGGLTCLIGSLTRDQYHFEKQP